MHGHMRMRGRHGRPPWAAGEWGADRGNWRGGGRRMRRGDIRTALLNGLTDGPAHGYELIGRLEEKSGGTWRPSPGSVYPTLQLFEDEGLVRSEERDGKRVYELTEAGRTEAAERAERDGDTPVGHRRRLRHRVPGAHAVRRAPDGGGQADRPHGGPRPDGAGHRRHPGHGQGAVQDPGRGLTPSGPTPSSAGRRAARARRCPAAPGPGARRSRSRSSGAGEWSRSARTVSVTTTDPGLGHLDGARHEVHERAEVVAVARPRRCRSPPHRAPRGGRRRRRRPGTPPGRCEPRRRPTGPGTWLRRR